MDAELLLTSASSAATAALGRLIGQHAGANAVLALDGELGAGKTTFVRGLAEGLGVEEPVSSPTYTLMHSYSGRLELFHFDAWMQQREAALFEGGAAEWLLAGGVAVVEWASGVAEFLPADRLEVELSHVSELCFDADGQLEQDQGRSVGLRALGPGSLGLLSACVPELGAIEGLVRGR